MVHGQIETDDTAVAPADDIGLPNVQLIEQFQHVVRHQRVTEGGGRVGGPAMAPAVHRNDEAFHGQRPDLPTHVLERAGAAVQHQDRGPTAEGLIPEAHTIDIGVLAAVCFGRNRAPNWKDDAPGEGGSIHEQDCATQSRRQPDRQKRKSPDLQQPRPPARHFARRRLSGRGLLCLQEGERRQAGLLQRGSQRHPPIATGHFQEEFEIAVIGTD